MLSATQPEPGEDYGDLAAKPHLVSYLRPAAWLDFHVETSLLPAIFRCRGDSVVVRNSHF